MPELSSFATGLIFLLIVVGACAAGIVVWVRKMVPIDSGGPLSEATETSLNEMRLLSFVPTLPPRTSPVDEHTKRLVSSVVNAGQKYLEGATSYSEFSLDVGGNLRALEGLSQSEKDALFYLECDIEEADFLLTDEELADLVQGVVYQLKEHFGV